MTDPLFEIPETHGLGQVLSHWTWLPSLMEQFEKSGRRFLNSGGRCVVRLLTPRNRRYEETYTKAFPFDSLVDGMMNESMIGDTVELLHTAIDQGVRIVVIVNNRAGGNAPLIAGIISEKFQTG